VSPLPLMSVVSAFCQIAQSSAVTPIFSKRARSDSSIWSNPLRVRLPITSIISSEKACLRMSVICDKPDARMTAPVSFCEALANFPATPMESPSPSVPHLSRPDSVASRPKPARRAASRISGLRSNSISLASTFLYLRLLNSAVLNIVAWSVIDEIIALPSFAPVWIDRIPRIVLATA